MKSDLLLAVTQLAAERALPPGVVLSAIQEALVSAYKRDSTSAGQDVIVKLDPDTGDMLVNTARTVVEDGAEIEDLGLEIPLTEALKIDRDATVGEFVITGTITQNPGRIAAQTAKQVVMQRLREAERELVFDEFQDKEGEVLTVTVQRADARQVVLDLGRAEAIMPPSEQVPTERYRPGYKFKIYIVEVARTVRGPEIIASRSHPGLIRRLFESEVPEIYNGVVEIKGIAREPGARSKVAVESHQQGVDAVGACVGLRGIRIQSVVNELHGEKIDVVEYDEDPERYVANALSPCQVDSVILDEEQRAATVIVPDRALSLAIGREGQNARLAAKLTDWRIDIKSASEAAAESETPGADTAVATTPEPAATTEIETAAQTPEPAPAAEPETPAIAASVEAPVEEAAAEKTPVEEPAPADGTPAEPVAAELETAPVAEAGEAAAAPSPAVSPEEDLALRALEEELAVLERAEQEQAAAAAEAERVIDFTADDVWALPEPATSDSSTSLRFAEDIIGYRDQGGSRRRGRGRRGGENLSPKARRAAARKASRGTGTGTGTGTSSGAGSN
ncbi:MAG: transcription termination factor NusA [Dehalococcoidia bacterium]